jgi:hypothetical protein
VPEALTLNTFRRAVALHRSGRTFEAVVAIGTSRSIDPAEAKRLVFHITAIPDSVIVAIGPLPMRSEICPTCHCVTIDFQEAEESGTGVLSEPTSKASNQAMQLTASKPAVHAGVSAVVSVCMRGMHIGLAAADLVSR